MRDLGTNSIGQTGILRYGNICKNRRNDYLRELNEAYAFFGLTMEAHLLATVMYLGKFFDLDKGWRKRPLTIYEFLDFVHQNLGVFSNQAFEKRMRSKETYHSTIRNHVEIACQKIEQDRKTLEKLPIRNLRKWRNKIFAHLDKEVVLQDIDISKQCSVKREQIDEIIDTLDNMLNDYHVAYCSTEAIKDEFRIEHDIQTILDSIRFKIREKRELGGVEENKSEEKRGDSDRP